MKTANDILSVDQVEAMLRSSHRSIDRAMIMTMYEGISEPLKSG